jgi:hypothetical protein
MKLSMRCCKIVDRILSEYGEALDLQYDLTNMSNMNMAMQDMSN